MPDEKAACDTLLALPDLQHRIAELMDKAMIRSENSYPASQELRRLAQEQGEAGAGEEARKILARAQGVIGMVNCSRVGDPMHDRVMNDLIAFKQEMRSGAREAR